MKPASGDSSRANPISKPALIGTLLTGFFITTSFGIVLPASPTTEFRPDRILIKPRDGTAGAVLNAFHRSHGGSVRKNYPDIGGLQVIALPGNLPVSQALRAYRNSSLVSYAEPDYLLSAARVPNDALYHDGSQWSLDNWGQLGGTSDCDIDAAEGWELACDASSILVSVIDSGVRVTHEDLAANLWRNSGEIPENGIDDDGNGYVDDLNGINAIDGSGNLADEFGHGTHVAGILGAVGNNGTGMAGTAWRIQMMGCKFLDSQLQGSVSDAVECINYARVKGARIVNASWGGKPPTSFSSAALYAAIDSLRQAGIIFVAAAGNFAVDNDSTNAFYPASFDLDNIISVAATTRDDDLAHFSDYGLNSVDLGAPGYVVLSCWSGNDSDYRTDDGTSMAAPHVAAACALAWALFPGSSYQQIIQRVLAGTDPVPALAGKCRTGGRLNLYKVLSQSAPPTTGAPPVLTVRGLTSETFNFRVSGDPATSFELQTSGDLEAWSAVQTFEFPAEGWLDFYDDAAPGAKFYRAAVR